MLTNKFYSRDSVPRLHKLIVSSLCLCAEKLKFLKMLICQKKCVLLPPTIINHKT